MIPPARDVKNPWLRRPLIVAVVVVLTPIVAALAATNAVVDWYREVFSDVRQVW